MKESMLIFRHRVTWEDTDYARVAYYPRFGIWADMAFHGYLLEHGFHVREFIDQDYGLPYISTACRYFKKITLEDEVEIALDLADLTPKGFTVKYRILKAGELAAEGEMVRRCIRGDPPKSAEMPQALRAALESIISR
jgi:YbgC/YbaW family acyl-CoA thioester hydrolase